MYLGRSLTQVIGPSTLLSRFPFFSTYLDTTLGSYPLLILELSQWPYWEFGIDVSQREYHSQLFCIWSSFILSYLPPNNYWKSIDTLILVLLYYPNNCVCFLVLLINPPLHVFYIWWQVMPVCLSVSWVGRKNSRKREIPTSYYNNLTSYVSYAYLLLRIRDHQRYINRFLVIPYYFRSTGNRIYIF